MAWPGRSAAAVAAHPPVTDVSARAAVIAIDVEVDADAVAYLEPIAAARA